MLFLIIVEVRLCDNGTAASKTDLTQAIQDSPLCEWNITVSPEFLVLLTLNYLDSSPGSTYYGLHVSLDGLVYSSLVYSSLFNSFCTRISLQSFFPH